MNEIILNTSAASKRSKLTREELLAGKCFPDDSDFSLDPRLKSPDELLAQRASAPSAAQTSIAALQKRYETEIQAWREYENKIHEWKKEVTDILEKFKAAAQEKEMATQELEAAREKLQRQEQELQRLRQQLTLQGTEL
jgi:chromosome segregation ATPase